jgi:hypothetical protein
MQKLQPTHRQPLWPAIRYFLLLGQWPPNRTTKPHRPLGWVALTELVALGHDAAVRRAAAAYAADLAEEAASFGFEPWAVSGAARRVLRSITGAKVFWTI